MEASAGSVTASGDSNTIVMESDDVVGLSLLSPNDAVIAFGDVADNDIGRIIYNHSTNSLRLWVNAAERVRINSAGSLGIGTNDPVNVLHAVDGNSNKYVFGGYNGSATDLSSDTPFEANAAVLSIVGGTDATAQDAGIHLRNENTNIDWSLRLDNATSDSFRIARESADIVTVTDAGISYANTHTTQFVSSSVNNLGDDGSIPITGTLVNVDANGGARTGIRFAGTGSAGQMLIVQNTGGESLTFHNTEGTALLAGVAASADTLTAGRTYMFISDGSLWGQIGARLAAS